MAYQNFKNKKDGKPFMKRSVSIQLPFLDSIKVGEIFYIKRNGRFYIKCSNCTKKYMQLGDNETCEFYFKHFRECFSTNDESTSSESFTSSEIDDESLMSSENEDTETQFIDTELSTDEKDDESITNSDKEFETQFSDTEDDKSLKQQNDPLAISSSEDFNVMDDNNEIIKHEDNDCMKSEQDSENISSQMINFEVETIGDYEVFSQIFNDTSSDEDIQTDGDYNQLQEIEQLHRDILNDQEQEQQPFKIKVEEDESDDYACLNTFESNVEAANVTKTSDIPKSKRTKKEDHSHKLNNEKKLPDNLQFSKNKVTTKTLIPEEKNVYFKCKTCHKEIKTKYNVERHLRFHPETPFVCNHCGKEYNNSASYKLHLRHHTGVKPFRCEICDKAFFLKTDLKMHMVCHTDERPYECKFCKKAFKSTVVLKSHISTVHEKKRKYECVLCDRRYSKSSLLKDHTARHHNGVERHPCEICKKSFYTCGGLIRHKKKYHVWKSTRVYEIVKTKENTK